MWSWGWVQLLDSHRIALTLYLTLGSLGIANAKSCNLWTQDTLPFRVSLSLFVNNYCVYNAYVLHLSLNRSQGHSTFFPIGCLLLFCPSCSLLSFFSSFLLCFPSFPLIFLSCLSPVSYRVILNRSSKCEHPCFVPYIEEKL